MIRAIISEWRMFGMVLHHVYTWCWLNFSKFICYKFKKKKKNMTLQGGSILAYNKVVEICQKFGVAVAQFAVRSHMDTVWQASIVKDYKNHKVCSLF